MAIITYENVTPSPIENAIVKKGLRDGVHLNYVIEAIDGYVLRDNRRDWVDVNSETGEETIIEGYMSGSISVAASYDFIANPFDLRAVLENSVPADQIFGGGNNNHEIM